MRQAIRSRNGIRNRRLIHARFFEKEDRYSLSGCETVLYETKFKELQLQGLYPCPCGLGQTVLESLNTLCVSVSLYLFNKFIPSKPY